MKNDEVRTQNIPMELPNGMSVKFEVVQTGREDVAFKSFSFNQVSEALEGVCDAIKGTLEKVKPTKATVKFGIEMAVESGELTAVIVKGSSKGNLEVTLEWENNS